MVITIPRLFSIQAKFSGNLYRLAVTYLSVSDLSLFYSCTKEISLYTRLDYSRQTIPNSFS